MSQIRLGILFANIVDHRLESPNDTKIMETLYNLFEVQLVALSFLVISNLPQVKAIVQCRRT